MCCIKEPIRCINLMCRAWAYEPPMFCACPSSALSWTAHANGMCFFPMKVGWQWGWLSINENGRIADGRLYMIALSWLKLVIAVNENSLCTGWFRDVHILHDTCLHSTMNCKNMIISKSINYIITINGYNMVKPVSFLWLDFSNLIVRSAHLGSKRFAACCAAELCALIARGFEVPDTPKARASKAGIWDVFYRPKSWDFWGELEFSEYIENKITS